MKTGFFRQVRELKIQRKNPGSALRKWNTSQAAAEALAFFQTPLKPAEVKIYLVTCTPITLKKSDELFISIINSALIINPQTSEALGTTKGLQIS
jgi:hypothetical protein